MDDETPYVSDRPIPKRVTVILRGQWQNHAPRTMDLTTEEAKKLGLSAGQQISPQTVMRVMQMRISAGTDLAEKILNRAKTPKKAGPHPVTRPAGPGSFVHKR